MSVFGTRWGSTIAQNSRLFTIYYKKPERVAWTILISAFFLFCISIVAIGWATNWYVTNARDTFPTLVTSINGTVLAQPVGDGTQIPILQGTGLEMDDVTLVRTDEDSLALFNFFDDTNVTLYSNTFVIIRESSRTRFDLSPKRDLIELEILNGRIRAVPAGNDSQRDILIRTPHAEVQLTQGSYAVEVNNERTQLTTRQGLATVSAQNEKVVVVDSELSTIFHDQPPNEPTAAEQDLLLNGDFELPLSDIWLTDKFIPPNVSDAITATVQVENNGDRPILAFRSGGEDNIHSEVGVEQIIGKDVRDFRSLRINADIFLDFQSLPGGGQLGSEFPILIKMSYKDAAGNDRDWYHGFYYESPPDHYILYNQDDNTSDRISQGLWFPYESENLLESLGEAKPVYVRSIRIYASGWIYDAKVADVEFLAED